MALTLAAGVARLRRRRLSQSWLELASLHLQVALFCAGGAALFLRAVARWESREAAPLLALALVTVLTAYVLARRRLPDAAAAAAWLDVHGGARGQVVTETELGGSEWSEDARRQVAAALVALPPLAWTRALRRALPAAAFAALAVWVPIPRVPIGPPPVLATAAIEELEEQLAALEETLDLPPATAEELEARLERLEAEAQGGQPASTFEALDRLGERLEAEAARALEAARRAGGDLASAAGDPDLAAAQAALESALTALRDGGLGEDLPETVQDALLPGSVALPSGVQLSSARLVELSRALGNALDARLGQLGAAGLLDPALLGELKLGELGNLADYDPAHECDEECKKPGGT